MIDLGKKALSEFESFAGMPLAVYTPDSYTRHFQIHGNAILSSVFVREIDQGATLDVNYYTYTTGEAVGERDWLNPHPVINSASSTPFKSIVNRFHQMVIMVVTVTGGNAEFSVYQTVIADMALDLNEDAVVNVANKIENNRTLLNTTTAVPIFPDTMIGQIGIMMKNDHETATIFLGATKEVAESEGRWSLGPGEVLPIDIDHNASIWAMANVAGVYIYWFRAGRQ